MRGGYGIQLSIVSLKSKQSIVTKISYIEEKKVMKVELMPTESYKYIKKNNNNTKKII